MSQKLSQYGSLEFAYAEPFANGLALNAAFREWVLRRTKFASRAEGASLLDGEMRALRSKTSSTWWRSHYTEKCRCEGCRGQETDILAIFALLGGERIALHIEVKQPTDRFPADKNQAHNYGLRAACWIVSPPLSVPSHSDADTLLLCSNSKLDEFAPHLESFGSVVTFEEMAEAFPHLAA